MTTQEVIRTYTKQVHVGRVALARDMQSCSIGNVRAIEAALGLETHQYRRHIPAEDIEDNTDLLTSFK